MTSAHPDDLAAGTARASLLGIPLLVSGPDLGGELEAKAYEELLRRPWVGLALDPEWRLQPGQKPMRQLGHVEVDEVNQVGAWLAGLVRRHDGQGGQNAKQGTWAALRRGLPQGVWLGWKNFEDEDTPMLTPAQTLAQVRPTPWFIPTRRQGRAPVTRRRGRPRRR